MEATGRIDELAEIMAGLDEPALTMSTAIQAESARVAYESIMAAVDTLEELTTGEPDRDKRRHYGAVWTDLIILAGDVRRTAGL